MCNFQGDLRLGQEYELKLLNHIPYKSFKQSEGLFKPYDIEVYKKNGGITTYEVKADRLINYYGNICIEFECNGEKSGISTSEAKYWAIFEIKNDDYTLYKIPRIVINENIKMKTYTRITMGGDNNKSLL